MKWFRKHLKHGSRLALFALAIQFGLSFGHFHAVTAQAAPAIATGLAQADADYANGLANQETSREAAKTQQPSAPDTDHVADVCAICAVIALANNVLFASPPLLQLPHAVELLYLTTDAEFAHLSSLRSAFQSRAPPAS
jgi:multidrug efflux pump subunit AcrB